MSESRVRRSIRGTVAVGWAVFGLGCSMEPERQPIPQEPYDESVEDNGGDEGSQTPASIAPDEGDLPAAVGPSFATLAENDVTVVQPGGATTCARGAPFSFFVRKGKENKILFDFAGGGACWDEKTCAFSSYLFSDTVRTPDPAKLRGIYDKSSPDNPFKDWTHVFVPYCTGDVHWGDNVATYGESQIQHKGAQNVRAVLAWLFANVMSPEKLLVTGCSAGSYGSIMWAPRLKRHYAKTPLVQVGDSGAGVITSDFFTASQASWAPKSAYPSWILPESGVTSLAELYLAIAKFYPKDTFSQINMLRDKVQVRFFTTMGGADASTWSAAMRASNDTIASGVPNYRYAVADGEDHCVLPFDAFYSSAPGGTKLVDWVRDMVDGKPTDDLVCDNCK